MAKAFSASQAFLQVVIVVVSLVLCFGCNLDRIKWWLKVGHYKLEEFDEGFDEWQK